MAIEVRPATVADAAAIAELHVKVWRQTYSHIAPADAQLALDKKHREAGWRARLSAPSPAQAVFVAASDGRLVGIVAAAGPSDAVFAGRGEISALYVDNGLQRRGIGRSLLATAMRHLRSQGFDGVGLGVVAGNDPAISFYTALGGRISGQYLDAGPVWRSLNIAIVWNGTELGMPQSENPDTGHTP